MLNLPKFKCHKIVGAARISSILGNEVRLVGQGEPVELPPDVTERIRKASERLLEPGYLVEYEDGYISLSPREAFENGYTYLDLQEDTAKQDSIAQYGYELISEVRALRQRCQQQGAQLRVLEIIGAVAGLRDGNGGCMQVDAASMLEAILNRSMQE